MELGIFTNQSFRKAAILFTVKTTLDLVKSHRKASESCGTLELPLVTSCVGFMCWQQLGMSSVGHFHREERVGRD